MKLVNYLLTSTQLRTMYFLVLGENNFLIEMDLC